MDKKVFNALVEDYRKTIPQKVQQIESQIKDLKSQRTLEALKALRFSVHKFGGSAGTYSFTAISTLCKAKELELNALIEAFEEKALRDVFFSNLNDFFIQLKAECKL